MYMISQNNYNHLFATKHMRQAEKIKETLTREKARAFVNICILGIRLFFSQNVKNRIYTVIMSREKIHDQVS